MFLGNTLLVQAPQQLETTASLTDPRCDILHEQGKNAADPFLRRMLLVQAAQQLDIATRDENQSSANEIDPLDLDSTRCDATLILVQLHHPFRSSLLGTKVNCGSNW